MKQITQLVAIFLMMSVNLHAVLPLQWETLALLNTKNDDIPKELQNYDNKKVEIAGFIVPLELDDAIDLVKVFILVPDPLSCVHVPPPSTNQMILVEMKKAIPLDMDLRGVAIRGVLSIQEQNVEGEAVSYLLKGVTAKEANIEVDDFWPDMSDLFY